MISGGPAQDTNVRPRLLAFPLSLNKHILKDSICASIKDSSFLILYSWQGLAGRLAQSKHLKPATATTTTIPRDCGASGDDDDGSSTADDKTIRLLPADRRPRNPAPSDEGKSDSFQRGDNPNPIGEVDTDWPNDAGIDAGRNLFSAATQRFNTTSQKKGSSSYTMARSDGFGGDVARSNQLQHRSFNHNKGRNRD